MIRKKAIIILYLTFHNLTLLKMNAYNFPPARYQRDSCVLEIHARVVQETYYEILVIGNGAAVSADIILECLDDYIDLHAVQVESVQVWLKNVQADSVYIQDRLNLEHNINAKVYVEERYTNGI